MSTHVAIHSWREALDPFLGNYTTLWVQSDLTDCKIPVINVVVNIHVVPVMSHVVVNVAVSQVC